MVKKDNVAETIETVFNDEKFLLEILDHDNYFNDEHLYEVLAITLDYYLATRNPSRNLSPKEIEIEFAKLNHGTMSNQQIEMIIDNGFLTHSFNGIVQDYIARYGFDYINKISREERKKLLHVREGLNRLESEIGKNHFQIYREEENEIEIVENELFISVPGTKTIHYCTSAPERLYLGPVGADSFSYFPMIIGESKKEYLMRILKFRIEKMTRNINQDELLEVAEQVINYYTKTSSSIAFIPHKDVIDKKIYSTYYGNGDGDNYKRFCERMRNEKYYVSHAFTIQPRDIYEEPEDIGNLVILANEVPIDNLTFSKFPDMYDLRQKYAKEKGIEEGTIVDYYSCKKIETISTLETDIKRYYKNI